MLECSHVLHLTLASPRTQFPLEASYSVHNDPPQWHFFSPEFTRKYSFNRSIKAKIITTKKQKRLFKKFIEVCKEITRSLKDKGWRQNDRRDNFKDIYLAAGHRKKSDTISSTSKTHPSDEADQEIKGTEGEDPHVSSQTAEKTETNVKHVEQKDGETYLS